MVFSFLFQAEDGIRDLVRSRGLGDVYKRQGLGRSSLRRRGRRQARLPEYDAAQQFGVLHGDEPDPVSYTHLTLPTSDLV